MNEDSCSFMIFLQCDILAYVCFLFLLYRRYISYRLLLSLKIFVFELETIPFWYRLLEPRTNQLSNVDRVSG